jgi:hypothetical protein
LDSRQIEAANAAGLTTKGSAKPISFLLCMSILESNSICSD